MKGKSFMCIPLEIKSMVYKLLFEKPFVENDNPSFKRRFKGFGYSLQGTTPLTWPTAKGFNDAVVRGKETLPFTARAKVCLLVAIEPIFLEGSPFLYRRHVYRMRLCDAEQNPLHLPYYPAGQASLFGIITSFELVSLAKEVCLTDRNVVKHLAFLRHHCPQLKKRSLGVELCTDSGTAVETSTSVLQQLWTRLDFLQVCVTPREEQKLITKNDLIAPGENWSREELSSETCEDALNPVNWQRTIFSVRRPMKVDVEV